MPIRLAYYWNIINIWWVVMTNYVMYVCNKYPNGFLWQFLVLVTWYGLHLEAVCSVSDLVWITFELLQWILFSCWSALVSRKFITLRRWFTGSFNSLPVIGIEALLIGRFVPFRHRWSLCLCSLLAFHSISPL